MKTTVILNPIQAKYSPVTRTSLYDTPQLSDGSAYDAVIMKWEHPLSVGAVEYWPLTAERLLSFMDAGFSCALLLRYTAAYELCPVPKYYIYPVRLVDPVTDAKGVTSGHVNVSHLGGNYFGLVDFMATTRVGNVALGGNPNVNLWNRSDGLANMALVWSGTGTRHDIPVLTQSSWSSIIPNVPLFSLSDVQDNQVSIADDWGGGVISYSVMRDRDHYADTYAEVTSKLPWGCLYSMALKNQTSSHYVTGASPAGYPLTMIPLSASDMDASRAELTTYYSMVRMTMSADGRCPITWSSQALRRGLMLDEVTNIGVAIAYGHWETPSEFANVRGFVGLAV